MTWLGLAGAFVVWAGIIWALCRMLGFSRVDDDPDERDSYN